MGIYYLTNEEYKNVYSLVEEGCLKAGRNIDNLWFNIGEQVIAPGMISCVKKYDGWYCYEYDDHAYLVDTIGPIKEFDLFMRFLSLKLWIEIEKIQNNKRKYAGSK